MKNKEIILNKLKEMRSEIDSIISILEENESDGILIKAKEVRKLAILTSIYKLGCSVNHEDFLNILKLYGRNPSASAGFFSGTNASLTRDKDNRKILTESGITAVRKSFIEWGDTWLDNLDIKFYTVSDNSIIKIK